MATKRAELLKKIQARKAEKEAAEKAKWAKMRHAAEEGASDFEKKLAYLSELCAAQAEAFENLKANLDLVQAPKEASLKVRVAAARNYAKSFQRIAEEAPEQLAEAVQEAYKSLDEIAGTLEMAADQLGVDLNATPAEEAFSNEGIEELEHGEEAGEEVGEEAPVDEEIKEGAGSDAWVTDRDGGGQPKTPERVEVPRTANSGPGSQGFVTDRSNEGKPETPKKVVSPQVEGGEAQTSIKDASRKRAEDGAASAESFVKDIPQSQGKAEVGAGKAGRVRPRTQIVSPGTPAAPAAEEFVKNIPQSQGKSEAAGNAKAAGRS
jgi:hypothetical protein